MAADHQSYQSLKRFAGLDGVRAIAITGVVWQHSAHPDFLPMFSRGFTGVDLFFALSGFLITTLLLREKLKTGKISLRNFWARRFLRLMPAYYLLLFGLLGLYLVFKPDDPDTARLVQGFPVYALYLSNWIHPGAHGLGITWSLATEEQFYLIWPVVETFFAPVAIFIAWLAAFVVNQLVNLGLLDPAIESVFGPGATHGMEILETTFTPILTGVALAHILHRKKSFEIASKIIGFSYAPFVFAGLLLVMLNIPGADLSGVFRLCLHLLMTAWIGSLVLAQTSPLTLGLEWRPIALIGAVSYGMYLYHMWCLHAVRIVIEKLGLPSLWTEFPLGMIVSLAVSVASFYLYEQRFLKLRSRFRK